MYGGGENPPSFSPATPPVIGRPRDATLKPMNPSTNSALARSLANESAMCLKQMLVAAPAAMFFLGGGAANASEPIKDTGAMACVTDKWDVKEPEKGHKLVDAAMRCVLIP